MEIANLTLVLAVHVMNHIHMCALGHTPYVCVPVQHNRRCPVLREEIPDHDNTDHAVPAIDTAQAPCMHHSCADYVSLPRHSSAPQRQSITELDWPGT